jgi:predicted branched-subunit amino acid permease
MSSPIERVAPRPLWRHPEFARGAREMVGTALGIAAWALVTGVAMAQSGLPMPVLVLMSLIVFAGSAQLAALPLLAGGAPLWVVWATAACVNLRFVIFSAGWRPYFAHLPRAHRVRLAYFTADLNYVLFMRRFPEPRPAPEQLPYFWGGVVCNWLAWQVPSLIGLGFADRIPTAWGLGFAGTLALLGITLSLLNDRATWIAAAVAIGLLIDHTTPRRVEPEDDLT